MGPDYVVIKLNRRAQDARVGAPPGDGSTPFQHTVVSALVHSLDTITGTSATSNPWIKWHPNDVVIVAAGRTQRHWNRVVVAGFPTCPRR
jgi:hypothetical protein